MSRNFELLQQMQRERSDSVSSLLEETQYSGGEWASDESLRLVQQIFLSQTQSPPRVVVFAGIDHGNGCSQICASVAETLAKNTSGSVCIVEANFRSPGLPELLRATNPLGLTDSLLQDGPIRSFANPIGIDKLWLLSCGTLTADSASLLSSEPIKARLAELRTEFDFVIIDAPPLTRYADAIALGQLSDGIVLILEAESTRREAAQMAAANLRASQVSILGAVLNKRTFPIPEKLYKWL
jgi:succinoglycan biosynthesis transport protein ExoP